MKSVYSRITGLSAVKGLAGGTYGSIPQGTITVTVQAETQAVRWRDDGLDPAATSGMILAAGESVDFAGDLTKLRFIEATASAAINLRFVCDVLSDSTPPTLESATINAAGTTLTLVFSEPVKGSAGFTITPDGGAATLTYASGQGTPTLTYTIGRTILGDETVTLDYAPGNVTDFLRGNALAAIADEAVTNESTQSPPTTTTTPSP